MTLTTALLDWAPAFALVFARIGAAMALLPGVGEAASPAMVRIGMALGLTILLLPEIQPLVPTFPDAGLSAGLMIAGEVATGLWFGWIARMIVLALPIAGQFVGLLIGLSSVLQPDPELGAQSGVLGKLFEVAAPVLVLAAGLYQLPLLALHSLFQLIPPGHMLPAVEGINAAILAVVTCFSLALQLASPFLVVAIAWQVAMGLVSRIIPRMQIYFVSMPGQIIMGFALLAFTTGVITLSWQDSVRTFLGALPGGS
jgi:flagellar biosynthesis protein FliR